MSDVPTRKGLSLSGFPLSAVGFVDCMLTQAVRVLASDVHLELGRLFKRSRDTRDLRELLVFIAPRIVRLPS